MHVLIIPSERLVPEDNRLEGIFPYHQAVILQKAGHRIGALSVHLSFSLVMIAKGLLYKLIGKKAGNATDGCSLPALWALGMKKIFAPAAFIDRERIEGVNVYRIDGLYRRPPVANKNHYSWVKAGLLGFRQYVKENGLPDVIHAHEAIYAGMLAEKISARWKIPYVLTEHSTFYATGNVEPGIFERVKKAYRRAKKLYAVSPLFGDFLNNLFAAAGFDYLPNVLDPELEEAAGEACDKKSTAGKRFRFLNIALFKPVKDQETLLKALKLVVEKRPDAELRIGGFGNLRKELESLVEQQGLQRHVRFLGELDRRQVIRELKSCNCFVLSSKYETFGVVMIEAMLFGKPVITTKVGVATDIINEQTGFLVDVQNVRAMADAMLKLMDEYPNYDPGYIRSYAVSHFGREAFVNRMNKIYSEVV